MSEGFGGSWADSVPQEGQKDNERPKAEQASNNNTKQNHPEDNQNRQIERQDDRRDDREDYRDNGRENRAKRERGRGADGPYDRHGTSDSRADTVESWGHDGYEQLMKEERNRPPRNNRNRNNGGNRRGDRGRQNRGGFNNNRSRHNDRELDWDRERLNNDRSPRDRDKGRGGAANRDPRRDEERHGRNMPLDFSKYRNVKLRNQQMKQQRRKEQSKQQPDMRVYVPPSRRKRPLIVINLEIDKIEAFEDDDPLDLATKFCKKNNLDDAALIPKIAEKVKDLMEAAKAERLEKQNKPDANKGADE